jgi:hypothetical protein
MDEMVELALARAGELLAEPDQPDASNHESEIARWAADVVDRAHKHALGVQRKHIPVTLVEC